ncbi:hypothetical protein FSP39_024315 [Pinctada imbricata]|uniref:DC-STAMP domain-containing protein 2 n=1 Tax=Pinctada imbricata TaxID=66713 RepID=A0AA89C7J1_PINIB|nr:hypothetical protein FSP39_024315 [Pinctada imbricata]
MEEGPEPTLSTSDTNEQGTNEHDNSKPSPSASDADIPDNEEDPEYQHNLEKAQTIVQQLFRSGREENRLLKAGFGFLAGLFGGGILFLMLYFFYKIPPLLCLYIVPPCTLILCLGMALSTGFRCVIMISLPTLTTGKGRTAIFSFVFALLLTGPVANISLNLHLISKTMSCSADLARNQTTALKKSLQDPVNKIKDKMDNVASTLSSVGDTLSRAFAPIFQGLAAVSNGLGAASGGLKEASYVCTIFSSPEPKAQACNKMFTEAYSKCYNGINSAYSKCRNALNNVPVIGKRDLTKVKERISRDQKFIAALEKVKDKYLEMREKFGEKKALEMIETLDIDPGYDMNGLMEDILSNFTSPHDHRSKRSLSDLCNVLNIGAVCNALSIGQGICKPVEFADNIVSSAAQKTNQAYNTVKDWFLVKVNKKQGLKGLVNASKTAAQIQQQIQEQLTADTSLIVDNLAIVGNLLAILLLFLIFQSTMYLRNYISRDNYDNIYITKQFREYDEECGITERRLYYR